MNRNNSDVKNRLSQQASFIFARAKKRSYRVKAFSQSLFVSFESLNYQLPLFLPPLTHSLFGLYEMIHLLYARRAGPFPDIQITSFSHLRD